MYLLLVIISAVAESIVICLTKMDYYSKSLFKNNDKMAASRFWQYESSPSLYSKPINAIDLFTLVSVLSLIVATVLSQHKFIGISHDQIHYGVQIIIALVLYLFSYFICMKYIWCRDKKSKYNNLKKN